MKIKLFTNKRSVIKRKERAAAVHHMMKAKKEGKAFITMEGEALLKKWKS